MEDNAYQLLIGIGICAAFGIELYVLSKLYGGSIYKRDIPKTK